MKVIQALNNRLSDLQKRPSSLARDTAIFYIKDTLIYHMSQIPESFSHVSQLLKEGTDSMFKIAESHQWRAGLGICYSQKASAQIYAEKDYEAVSLFLKAAEILGEEKKYWEQAYSYMLLAASLVYRKNSNREEWSEALGYMEKARRIAYRHRIPVMMYQVENYTGDFYIIRKNYKEALRYYLKVMPLLKENPHLSGNRTNFAYLGICYLNLEEPDLARKYLDEFFKISNPEEGAYASYLHHQVLFELGQYYQKERNFDLALKYQKEYSKILSYRPLFDVARHYFSMYEIYKAKGSFQKALKYHEKWTITQDSLKTEELSKTFKEIEQKYDLKEKESQIAELRAQNLMKESEKAKTLRNSAILLFFISCLLLFFIFRSLSTSRKNAELKLSLSQTQNDLIKQIIATQNDERERIAQDLHDDLGGIIGTIQSKIDTLARFIPLEKVQDILTISALAGDRIRQISHNLMPPEFEKAGLLETVKELLTENTRPEFRLSTFGNEKRMSPERELNIYRILSELFVNLRRHSGAEIVKVQFFFHPDMLTITLEDNGKMGTSVIESKGLGIRGISARLGYLGGTLLKDQGDTFHTTILNIPYM